MAACLSLLVHVICSLPLPHSDMGGPGVYESSFSTDHLPGTVQHITQHRWTGMVHPSWLQTAVASVRSECEVRVHH